MIKGFGDWMVFFMLARNTDRVLFAELIDYIKYPDWNWEQEPLDEHNYRILRQRMKSEDFEEDNVNATKLA